MRSAVGVDFPDKWSDLTFEDFRVLPGAGRADSRPARNRYKIGFPAVGALHIDSLVFALFKPVGLGVDFPARVTVVTQSHCVRPVMQEMGYGLAIGGFGEIHKGRGRAPGMTWWGSVTEQIRHA